MNNRTHSPLRVIASDKINQDKHSRMTENNHDIDGDKDVVSDRHDLGQMLIRDRSTGSVHANGRRDPGVTGGGEINNGEERRIEDEFKNRDGSSNSRPLREK